MTLTIDPPITEHCRECSYEASVSFTEQSESCPECRKATVNPGRRIKAEDKPVSVNAITSSTNEGILRTYVFSNIPGCVDVVFSLKSNNLIPTEDPLNVINEIIFALDIVFTHKDHNKAAMVQRVLSSDSEIARQKKLRFKQRKLDLEEEIYRLNEEFQCYCKSDTALEKFKIEGRTRFAAMQDILVMCTDSPNDIISILREVPDQSQARRLMNRVFWEDSLNIVAGNVVGSLEGMGLTMAFIDVMKERFTNQEDVIEEIRKMYQD